MTVSDAKLLMEHHICHLTSPQRNWLNNNAVYLYATKSLKADHNMRKLNELSSEQNPVLFIQTKYQKRYNSMWNGNPRHFDKDSIPSRQILCKGAKVAITNRNFQPNWGLYNGALGTVMGIKFKQNENPQGGHLPLFVVVDFTHYTGPTWMDQNPTFVPIPIVTTPCKKGCYVAHFLPLCLAFARTIHKFQGMEAGPSKHIKAIVVDVGSTKFEALNPGLLYTALSRASALEAIYFSGPLTYDRLTNVKYKRNLYSTRKEPYEKIIMQDKWIHHLLEKKTHTKQVSNNNKINLKVWINNISISIQELDTIINFHKNHEWI